jgi:monoamine oxidase
VDEVAENKSLDGGAELIGDNHPLWLHYADYFGLSLSDARDYSNSPVVVDGRLLSGAESGKLANRLDKLITQLTQAAEGVIDPFEPWINPDARELDNTSLDRWLTRVKGHNDAKTALRKMLEADGGVTAKQQSLLGVLAMVRGGGLDRYWTDSELHRCEGGTQSLANAFKDKLAGNRVTWHTATQVCGLTVDESEIKVFHKELEIGPGGATKPLANLPGDAEESKADYIVLAIPPSVWSTILSVAPSNLATLLAETNSPQMGTNVKNLMAFERRFWRDTALGPALTADAEVDMTWETTEEDPEDKPQFGLVAFSGAEEARKLSRMDSAGRTAIYAKRVGGVYRHYHTELVRHKFMDWPNEDWTKASYCFPAPGEVTKWGPIYKAGFMNRLHFAGEHTCYAYMGYMEGALSSGYRVAARIAVRGQLGIR